MSFSRENVLGGLPKITEGVTVFGVLRDCVPETKAGRKARGHLERRPQSALFAGTSLSRPTVFALSSAFDDMGALTDTAGVRHCFLNHDPNSISSLTS